MSNVGHATEFFTRLITKKSEAVVAPQLRHPVRLPNGAFQFRVHVIQGVAYQVQASTNLSTWTVLESGQAATETLDFCDTAASQFVFRFYRVIINGTLPSRNILGHASVTIPSGFAMISNPFLAPSNAVSALFGTMPEGTTLSKFDTNLFRLTENVFRKACWLNPSEMLLPGEGAIVFNPGNSARTIYFCGDVMQGNLSCPISAGFSIRSSQLPVPGRLTDLGFPIAPGDAIHLFDRERQKYRVYAYPSADWDKEPPALTVGESFWVGKVAQCNWTRTFVSQ